MDINSTKLELFDWLLHINDEKLLEKTLSIKQSQALRTETTPIFERLKGKIIMSDDFNAPLDDFKEYMP